MKTLAIVSGAAEGNVGAAMIAELISKGVACVGIARRPVDLAARTLQIDLLDEKATVEAIGQVPFKDYDRLIIVHCVGCFKLELANYEYVGPVDPMVLASNLHTIQNLCKAVLRQRGDARIPITITGLGSIAGDYEVPIYRSYTESKQAVQQYLKQLVIDQPLLAGVFLKLCTVLVPSEVALRPLADTSYWLKPEDLARQSAALILATPSGRYIEQDIYAPKPGFDSIEQYVDLSLIRERWIREMNLK